jgi:hypothetical protein
MSIKLTNSRRLFVTTVAAGLLAWTHGTANATLLPGEGVGLYTQLDSSGEDTGQTDEVYYNSTLGVIGPVTAPGVTTVFAPTFPFYTPVLTTTPGTLQPGAVSAGLSLVTGPDQATVFGSLATGSITGPKGEKRPADVIGNAVKVMRIATGEETETLTQDDGKDPAAKGRHYPMLRALQSSLFKDP